MGDLTPNVAYKPYISVAIQVHLADEDVLGFEVPVEDIVSVAVGQTPQQLEVEGLEKEGQGEGEEG